MGKRKLRYSVVAVEKKVPGGIITINMDSQAPNRAVGEALEAGKLRLEGMGELKSLKSEYRYGASRMDFYAG